MLRRFGEQRFFGDRACFGVQQDTQCPSLRVADQVFEVRPSQSTDRGLGSQVASEDAETLLGSDLVSVPCPFGLAITMAQSQLSADAPESMVVF